MPIYLLFLSLSLLHFSFSHSISLMLDAKCTQFAIPKTTFVSLISDVNYISLRPFVHIHSQHLLLHLDSLFISLFSLILSFAVDCNRNPFSDTPTHTYTLHFNRIWFFFFLHPYVHIFMYWLYTHIHTHKSKIKYNQPIQDAGEGEIGGDWERKKKKWTDIHLQFGITQFAWIEHK